MLSLAPIRGPYAVGISSFAAAVPPRSIGPLRTRDPRTGQLHPALRLDHVAFTAYYPADISTDAPRQHAHWFPRPLHHALQGLASYLGFSKLVLWPLVYLFGAFVKIPAYPNAPLLNPSKASQSPARPWPLVLFSHGLGGSTTAYSQLCSRLAASGNVVLAIEHRDGTAMFCKPRPHPDSANLPMQPLPYLRNCNIVWPDSEPSNEDHGSLPLRAEQLAFRHHEIYRTYSIFSSALKKESSTPLTRSDGSTVHASWLDVMDNGESIIRFQSNVTLAGHSFGGCSILSILSTKPHEGYDPMPIDRVVLLDPWLDPLPSPGPTPFTSDSDRQSDSNVESLTEDLKTADSVNTASNVETSNPNPSPLPPLLVLNSETFTLWKDHFERLEDIIYRWEPRSKLLTLVGSEHLSFSDFSVLPLFSRAGSHMLMDTICSLTLSFLDDNLEHALEGHKTCLKKMEVEMVGTEKDGTPKRRIIGNKGDIILHQ